MLNEIEPLTVGSLFSGIGGLDLGLERAGMVVKWQSEIDPYACKVLNKHWPDVPNLGDIKTINWKETERVDVICGGYPCQPFSTAGKRRGQEDPRHLWPWVRDAISELRPRYAILENVRGHLSMGGLSVISELTALGYSCEWRVISAASVGANHKRDRIIIVAYAEGKLGYGEPDYRGNSEQSETATQFRNGSGAQNVADTDGDISPDGGQRTAIQGENSSWGNDRSRGRGDTRQIGMGGPGQAANGLADTDGERLERGGRFQGRKAEHVRLNIFGASGGRPQGTEIPDADAWQDGWRVGGVQQGTGLVFGGENIGRRAAEYAGWEWWLAEPDVGRVAYGVPSRVDRLKGLGNAVVPQVAEIVGRLVVGHYLNDY